MCYAAIASAAAGSTASAFGAYYQGRSAKAALNYEAKMNDINARMAESQIPGVQFEGGVQVDRIRADGQRFIGSGRADMAAGGVDMSSGTPVFWELDAAKSVATDVGIAKYNTAQRVVGLKTEAWNYRTSAGMNRFLGTEAMKAGMLSATGSLLSGAGQSAGAYAQYRSQQSPSTSSTTSSGAKS